MDLQTKAYFLLNKKPYFKMADEYVGLQQTFVKDTLLESLSLWMDMVIYPLGLLIAYIFFDKKPSIFSASSIHKMFTTWIDWFKFKWLNSQMSDWMRIVRSQGGPFISTNDPTYHMYVYADGMQRLHDSLPISLPEKRAKRLE
jgi:hypothetical protein